MKKRKKRRFPLVPLAMLVQWLERRSKRRPRAKVIPGITDVAAKEA